MNRIKIKCYYCEKELGYCGLPENITYNSDSLSNILLFDEFIPICCNKCEAFANKT